MTNVAATGGIAPSPKLSSVSLGNPGLKCDPSPFGIAEMFWVADGNWDAGEREEKYGKFAKTRNLLDLLRLIKVLNKLTSFSYDIKNS